MSLDIPGSWAVVPIDAVARVEMGQSPPSSSYNDRELGLPFFQGKAEFGPMHPIPVKWCNAPTKLAEPQAVLLSVRAPVGPTNLAVERSCIGRGLAALHPLGGIDSRYLLYAVRATSTALERKATGSTFGAVSGATVRSHLLPIAPIQEQRRIVEALETQFTRLDAAAAMLERVRAGLERYRASILHTAIVGNLAPNEAELARREHREFESGTEVVRRGLLVRRQRLVGRTGSYVEPEGPETAGLWDLPEGWAWATWEQASERVTVGHVGKMHYQDGERGIPFLRSQNVRENRFEPEGLLTIIPEFHASLSKSALRPGDLLIVRSGAPGTACVVPDHLTDANCADLVIVKQPIAVRPHFGAYFMNSLAKATVRRQQVGIAQLHFNTKSAAALPVPVPPLAEQDRIIEAVERHLSEIDAMEGLTNRSLLEISRIRRSLLQTAFDGRLVPQDPSDEPASVLLDRIRASRAATPPTRKRTSSRSPR